MGSLITSYEEKYKMSMYEEHPDHLEGLYLSGCGFTPEIIYHILSFVPKEDLTRNCVRVCKMWKQLLDDQAVWKLKCLRSKLPFPRHMQNMPKDFYKKICFKNPYGRNLIKNPCGREQFAHWNFNARSRNSDGWVVEDPPVGADPVSEIEDLKGASSCFSTSFFECTKYQMIDLKKEGCMDDILDNLQPTISITDWYAARWDCASRYHLKVGLLDADKKEIEVFNHGPIDQVQWVGRQWYKVEHRFQNYGPGVRFIHFEQLGHDLQFWAGQYGSKMTGSSVHLFIND